MADDKYADLFFVDKAKQDRVWKTVRETAANAALDHGILERVGTDAGDGCIDLRSKLGPESVTLLVVVRNGVIKIRYGTRVIFNLHSEPLPVSLRNSA